MSENNAKRRPIIIGVTGGSGSGKTTVSRAMFEALDGHSLLMVEEDSYYKNQDHLPMEERVKANYDHPDAFDTDLLIEQLQDLLEWKTIEKPVYDYVEHTRSQQVVLEEPREVIIVEGILVLNDPRVRDLMDIKIFVDTDDDIRLLRRIQRDMEERGRSLESVITQYTSTVKPMYHQFIEPTKRYADIIVPEGGENQVAIDILVTKVRDIIRNNQEFTNED
ncbi:uridine kinase [Ligilactobacillus ceti]|uniref:Uridine kinase n=1 Tax=Ligilactobacillus ceti DSM 22408 TaxID=1122146 RepID=A0A0R2KH86_9LACO|nr:uridine kinase [Ligilactobacillus ceti]KRN88755.1 uridine kinase [Ligilactobacillus ceti DSM 22408]